MHRRWITFSNRWPTCQLAWAECQVSGKYSFSLNRCNEYTCTHRTHIAALSRRATVSSSYNMCLRFGSPLNTHTLVHVHCATQLAQTLSLYLLTWLSWASWVAQCTKVCALNGEPTCYSVIVKSIRGSRNYLLPNERHWVSVWIGVMNTLARVNLEEELWLSSTTQDTRCCFVMSYHCQ